MPKLLNFDILGNPYNWVKVNIMAMIGLMVLFFVAKLFEGNKPDGTE